MKTSEQGGAVKVVPGMEGDYGFGADEFRRIAAMLHGDAGIHLPETKMTLVYSRLVKRLRTLGLSSFRDYCDLVSGKDGQDERQQMLVALTTNVTSFFREPHHFEHLKTVSLPPLVERAKRGGRVRLWSSACSRGHEPYSIAMTLLSVMPDANNYDIKILATDIDTVVLAEGRAASYDEATVSRVPKPERSRFFRTPRMGEGGKYTVCDDARALVSFRELNLIGQWPMKGVFDVIFCRNVLIYFDDATQEKVWTRFAGLLPTDAFLYIGHSERVSGKAQASYATAGLTTYRRIGGGRA